MAPQAMHQSASISGTMEIVLPIMIAGYRSEISGQLSDRNRVMDALLDMRLDAGDNADVCELLDSLLSDLPGLTVVENEWWGDALDQIEGAATSESTAV